MGKRYRQIDIRERCEISRLREEGRTICEIAASMGRAKSTISRELRRNGKKKGEYEPVYAERQAVGRRWRGSKLERDDELRELVLAGLRAGLSPEQVACSLELLKGEKVISHESIYRFVHGQIGRTKDYGWRNYLPQRKSKRGYRGRRGGSPASFIKMRRSIWERPECAETRDAPGHWEADLMMFSRHGQAVLALHERQSRILLGVRLESKASDPVAEAMERMLAPLPAEWRRTMTFDNGTEFAKHYRLHELGMETFFCDVRSPWQKGGVENAIGRLRRSLPRKTDLGALSDEEFERLFLVYNNTPRKCLGFRTPAEVFLSQALHLKCESIFPLSRE